MIKPPDLRQTTLRQGRFNATLARLQERAEDAGYDLGEDGLCTGCDCLLTEADVEYGACTQCGAGIPALDGDDYERE